METLDCWVSGKKLAAWIATSSQFEPVVHVLANREGLESMANVLRKLAGTAVGGSVSFDTLTGLDAGDVVLTFEHASRFTAPTVTDLMDTRVTAPEDGETVLWARVTEEKREDVSRLLILEAGYTSLQAREAISRGGTLACRLGSDPAVRLRDSMRRIGVDCALFELRS